MFRRHACSFVSSSVVSNPAWTLTSCGVVGIRYFSAMRMRATCKMELFDFDSACKDWEWVMDRRMFLPDGEAPLVRKELRRARKCRDATHYDILGINKLASQKDIIKVSG